MAWEISITNDGWSEIRIELDKWAKKRLIQAISDNEFERIEHEEHADINYIQERIKPFTANLKRLYKDTLQDIAFGLIEENNTCDNGGFNYWIDREGYHKVTLKE